MTNEARRCPECGYDLTGLPDGRGCPECGLPFETGTIVFSGRRGDGVLVHAIRIAATFWVGSSVISHAAQLGAAVRNPYFLLDLLLVFLVVLSWSLWWRHRRPYYVLLGSESVVYREAGEEVLRVRLSDIRSAEYNSLSKDIDLITHDGTRIESLPDLRQRNYAEITALCKAITDRAQAVRE